jgi:plasmid maintenance system killer protein
MVAKDISALSPREGDRDNAIRILVCADWHINLPYVTRKTAKRFQIYGTSFGGHNLRGFFLTLPHVDFLACAGDMHNIPNGHNDQGAPHSPADRPDDLLKNRFDPETFYRDVLDAYPHLKVWDGDGNHNSSDHHYFRNMRERLTAHNANYSSGKYLVVHNLIVSHLHDYIRYIHEGPRGKCYFAVHRRPIADGGKYSAIAMKGLSKDLYKRLARAICKIDIVQAFAERQCEMAQIKANEFSLRNEKRDNLVHIHIAAGHLHRNFHVETNLKLDKFPGVTVVAHVTSLGCAKPGRGSNNTIYEVLNGEIIATKHVDFKDVSRRTDKKPVRPVRLKPDQGRSAQKTA